MLLLLYQLCILISTDNLSSIFVYNLTLQTLIISNMCLNYICRIQHSLYSYLTRTISLVGSIYTIHVLYQLQLFCAGLNIHNPLGCASSLLKGLANRLIRGPELCHVMIDAPQSTRAFVPTKIPQRPTSIKLLIQYETMSLCDSNLL